MNDSWQTTKKPPLAGRENLSGLCVVTNRVTPNGVSITAYVGNELSAAIRRKEMTLGFCVALFVAPREEAFQRASVAVDRTVGQTFLSHLKNHVVEDSRMEPIDGKGHMSRLMKLRRLRQTILSGCLDCLI